MFSKKNTICDVLNAPEVGSALFVLFPRFLLDFVPEEYWARTIEECEKEVRMPWGVPFVADEFLSSANMVADMRRNRTRRFVYLWESEEADDVIPAVENNDKSSVFLLTKNESALDTRPAVVICPGGGYQLVSMNNEGIQIAEFMEAYGYRAFVLNYRVSPNRYPSAQFDLKLAVKHV